jgi:hypothetical protein
MVSGRSCRLTTYFVATVNTTCRSTEAPRARAGYLGHLRETTEELRRRLSLIGDPERGRSWR